jgi:hypothetical protein
MASKRGIRRRRCVGKKRYESARHAAFDAAVLSRQQRERLEAYRCPHCGGIHVGHVPHLATPAPAPGWRRR